MNAEERTEDRTEDTGTEQTQPPSGAADREGTAGQAGDQDLEVEVVEDDDEDRTAIQEPHKLMRIALMLREMQEEVRRASPDDAGRDRLRVVHERAVKALCGVLSQDLQDELSELTLPFEHDTPTESEILISQAQLIGWLEGLFQGIQAAIFNQQLQARQQLEQMRHRGLPPGARPGQPGDRPQHGTGQYL